MWPKRTTARGAEPRPFGPRTGDLRIRRRPTPALNPAKALRSRSRTRRRRIQEVRLARVAKQRWVASCRARAVISLRIDLPANRGRERQIGAVVVALRSDRGLRSERGLRGRLAPRYPVAGQVDRRDDDPFGDWPTFVYKTVSVSRSTSTAEWRMSRVRSVGPGSQPVSPSGERRKTPGIAGAYHRPLCRRTRKYEGPRISSRAGNWMPSADSATRVTCRRFARMPGSTSAPATPPRQRGSPARRCAAATRPSRPVAFPTRAVPARAERATPRAAACSGRAFDLAAANGL